MNNCDLRHVCFKDLEKYWRKDDYFNGLNESEKEKIKINLGLDTKHVKIHSGSYEDVLRYVDNDALQIGHYYIIDDFKSIYECNNMLCGLENNPSEKYILLLTPISENEFSEDIKILNHISWEAKYSIKRTIYNGGKDMGKILYLKDDKNNSAYYDFKNVKFYRTQEDLNLGEFDWEYANDAYLPTFNSVSENNHLGPKCTNIVILDKAINNTFDYKCTNITILGSATNNNFGADTRNVIFASDIKNCEGKIHDARVFTGISSDVYKKFMLIGQRCVMLYLDPETLTTQFYYV